MGQTKPMSYGRPQPGPRTPTLPSGQPVAAYATYLEAQQAVDYLAEQKFPVQGVTIVGTDLRMVERVTGRLSYGRVAVAGAMSGAWFGLFVGLLLSMLGGAGGPQGIAFISVGLGAGFGLLFSVLSYSLARGKRDFTSSSQIVASTYAILCEAASASEARSLLMRSPNGLGKSLTEPGVVAASGTMMAPTTAPVAASATDGTPPADTSRKPDPRWTTPDGRPRYGAMSAEVPPAASVPEASAPTLVPAPTTTAPAPATSDQELPVNPYEPPRD